MEQAIFSVLPQRTIQASLQFEFCGFSKTLDHHSFGPAVRDLYILHLVLDGEGMYTVKNKQYSLKKGDFFLIRPHDTTFYSSSIKDPWSYIWLAFSGATADQVITKSCLERDYYVASTTNITPYISTIQACLELDHSDLIQELKLTELTYRFLALFVQDAVNSEPNIAQKVSPLILQVIQLIKEEYQTISIQQLAATLAVNRSHLSRQFKKEMNMTIQQWLMSIRINQAAFLLINTDQSVESISEAVRFSSLVSFSRAFHRYTNEAPTTYRKRVHQPEGSIDSFETLIKRIAKQSPTTRST